MSKIPPTTCKVCGGDGPRRLKLRTCMDCEAAAQRERYRIGGADAQERSRLAEAMYRERNPEQVRARTRRAVAAYRERHRDRLAVEQRERHQSPEYKARYEKAQRACAEVRRAIKAGNLIRPETCSSCGIQCKPEAAHTDYSKPLEVRWLCLSCHRRWDALLPKSR